MKKSTKNHARIVCIGGGTGTYSVLTGLRTHFDDITAIVSMADTGGSARKERDEFGLLPSSDIRKSLIGLADTDSEAENIIRDLFQYRYNQGKGVQGMTFGNLFLVALTKLLGSQTKAIEKAGQVLRIRGRVLPVSIDPVDLVATYENGMQITGEHAIDEPQHDESLRITKLATSPPGSVYPPVMDAIGKSDVIVLGPGGLYTTLIANLVIDRVVESITRSKAKVVYIMNLMTEPGQTFNFSAKDHIDELEKYLGKGVLTHVLINTARMPKDIVEKYQATQASKVVDDLEGKKTAYTVIRDNFLTPKEIARVAGDTLKRSLIRHDPKKIAAEIMHLV